MDDYKTLSRKEWELWQEVCSVLKEVNAITEEDLKKTKSDQSTPGSRLINLLNKWSMSVVRLHQIR